MELVELEGSPRIPAKKRDGTQLLNSSSCMYSLSPLTERKDGSSPASHVPPPLTLDVSITPTSPSPTLTSPRFIGYDNTDGWSKVYTPPPPSPPLPPLVSIIILLHAQQISEVRKGQNDIIRLLKRKRTTSSSSDDDPPRTPSTPIDKPSPSRTYGIPLIGKIPLTPLSKASPKTDRRSWTGDQLIGGKYDVTSKDKSVLERISQRVHCRGSRVRKPHEVNHTF